MPLFFVTISRRVSEQVMYLQVEADNSQDAEEIGFDMCLHADEEDWEPTAKEGTYTVEGCELLEAGKEK